MIGYVLLGMLLLYIFYLIFSGLFTKITKIKLCAICAAVSTTWIILLILKFVFNYNMNSLIIGILMGQSITGLMYLLENYAKRINNKRLLMLRIFVILIGTFIVYEILR
mgnify:CR=1 FL=1